MNIKSKKTNDAGIGGEKEEEEEDYEIGESEAFTTLRKSAAFTLEKFSSKNIKLINLEIYHEEVFFILNSHLEQNLKSQQWEIKEQAILALFAISDPDGSTNVINPHL